MAGRFSTHQVVAPAIVPAIEEPVPQDAASFSALPVPVPEPVAPVSANPLLTDKLLDAKVRLHRRLIEEINLSALEKLPEDEMRGVLDHELLGVPAAREGHDGRLEPVVVLGRALLEEERLLDAVRIALEHARAVAQVHDRRPGDGEVVLDDVALAPARLREEHLVGAREPHLAPRCLDRDRVVGHVHPHSPVPGQTLSAPALKSPRRAADGKGMADKSDLLRPVDIATRIGDVLFTVGQVCTIAGITKMQLDLWTERAAIETLGAKQRLYDVDAVEHVMLIAQARSVGFSVDAAIDAAALFRSRHGLDQSRIAA